MCFFLNFQVYVLPSKPCEDRRMRCCPCIFLSDRVDSKYDDDQIKQLWISLETQHVVFLFLLQSCINYGHVKYKSKSTFIIQLTVIAVSVRISLARSWEAGTRYARLFFASFSVRQVTYESVWHENGRKRHSVEERLSKEAYLHPGNIRITYRIRYHRSRGEFDCWCHL